MNARAIVFYGSIALSASLGFVRCSSTGTSAVPCAESAGGCPLQTPSPSPSPMPSGQYACTAIALVGPALLSPAPGATNVPRSAGSVEIAAFPIPIAVSLVPASGSTIALGIETPAPSPAPSGTGAPTTFAYAALMANTTYAVQYNDDGDVSRCPTAITSGGSFTTGS